MKRRYPSSPLIGVGALIKDGDEVIVVKRENEPSRGLWSIPGGLLELGERLDEAVRREVREETGLEVEVEKLLDAVDNIVYDEDGGVLYHYVLIDYLCRPQSEDLKAASDVEDAMWIRVEELESLPATGTLKRLLSKINCDG